MDLYSCMDLPSYVDLYSCMDLASCRGWHSCALIFVLERLLCSSILIIQKNHSLVYMRNHMRNLVRVVCTPSVDKKKVLPGVMHKERYQQLVRYQHLEFVSDSKIKEATSNLLSLLWTMYRIPWSGVLTSKGDVPQCNGQGCRNDVSIPHDSGELVRCYCMHVHPV
jgi:hypothetical protein